MFREFTDARRRAVSQLYVQGFALLALIAGAMATVPPAFGQAMQAALGVYRPSISKYFLDGNFDHVAEFKLLFGAPGLDIGLLGDLSGSGSRYPVLYRSGVWYVDSNKDAGIDQTFYFGGAPNDIPLIADMDGDGLEDPVLFRDGIWYVSAAHNGVVSAVYGFGAPGDIPLVADVTGTGSKGLFVYRNGVW